MVARISRLLAVALLASGCQTAAVPIPHVPEPEAPRHVTRIVFSVDVLDEAEICADVTAPMVFREPNVKGPVCGLTVGELRAWLQRLSRAD